MAEIQGLTESEARERRERGLGNDAKVRTGRSYWDIARANLFTTFNNILFVIGSPSSPWDAITTPRPAWESG